LSIIYVPTSSHHYPGQTHNARDQSLLLSSVGYPNTDSEGQVSQTVIALVFGDMQLNNSTPRAKVRKWASLVVWK